MEPRHREITEIALAAAGEFGFALAGGYAVRAHGMGDRLSGDVDLFIDTEHRESFPTAIDKMISALAEHGYSVETAMRDETFARLLLVKVGTEEIDKLELAVDWRAHPPVTLDLGPVLHPDDAVANKMCALFGRAEARDFLDIDAAITSGHYTRERLIELASQTDAGFDPVMFADAIGSLAQRTNADFNDYQVTDAQIAGLRSRFADWAATLRTGKA